MRELGRGREKEKGDGEAGMEGTVDGDVLR